jgi:hypothetical protein
MTEEELDNEIFLDDDEDEDEDLEESGGSDEPFSEDLEDDGDDSRVDQSPNNEAKSSRSKDQAT